MLVHTMTGNVIRLHALFTFHCLEVKLGFLLVKFTLSGLKVTFVCAHFYINFLSCAFVIELF